MNSEFSIAVHALVVLNHKACTLSSVELSENICTNPARIRKVMSKLKRGGLISTREGLDGGYHLEKGAGNVSLKDICTAIGIDLVSSSWKSGDINMDCLIASGMGGVLDNIYKELNGLCMERLSQITVYDIDKELFTRNPV